MFSHFRSRINSRLIGLRMARRDVLRNKFQSVLVILAIAIPITLAAFAFTHRESTHATSAETAEYSLGTAQAKVEAFAPPSKRNVQYPDHFGLWYLNKDGSFNKDGSSFVLDGTSPKHLDPRKLLPGYSWLSERQTTQLVKTKFGNTHLSVIEVDAANKKLAGRYFDFAGEAPSDFTTVLVNRAALTRLHAQVGSTINFSALGREAKILGTIEDSQIDRNSAEIFVLPGFFGDSPTPTQNTVFYAFGHKPLTWAQTIKLNRQGVGTLSRSVLLNPPSDAQVPLLASGALDTRSSSLSGIEYIMLILPLLLLPVIALTASAFSFAARRQTRSIAVISSLGARRATLRFVTISNGIWLGVLGGVVGAVAGATLSALLSSSISDGSKINYPGFHLPVSYLITFVLSGALIGAIVSALPARAAAKVDVLATLRGTRRDPKVRKRTGVFSLILILAGAAGLAICAPIWAYVSNQQIRGELSYQQADKIQALVIYLAVFAAIAAIIGLLVGSSWVLIFARFVFKRFGTSASYATNDLVFNRKRFTAVIASVIATSFIAATILALFYTVMKPEVDTYQPITEPNQILLQTGYNEKRLHSKADLQAYLTARAKELRQQLDSASTLAPTKSSGLISMHQTFATQGFEFYSTGELILGAEGQVPYAHINRDYLCPYMSGSPMAKTLTNLYAKGDSRSANRILALPKYKNCGLIPQATSSFIIADAQKLRLLMGGRIDGAAEAALGAGKAVVFNRGFLTGDKLQLNWYPSGIDPLVLGEKELPELKYWPARNADGKLIDITKPSRTESIEAVTSSSNDTMLAVVIPPATATRLGIDFHVLAAVVNYKSALTTDQKDALFQALPGGYTYDPGLSIDLERASWIIALIAGLFIMATTLIALALSQIESKADQSTLWSVGASKSFRAKVLTFQAIALTLLGSVFGATVGLALSLVLSNKLTSDFAVPVVQLLTLTLGMPIAAAALTMLFTPRRYTGKSRLALD